jgi:hypothetical protein
VAAERLRADWGLDRLFNRHPGLDPGSTLFFLKEKVGSRFRGNDEMGFDAAVLFP